MGVEDDFRYVKSPVGRFHSFSTNPAPSMAPMMLQSVVDDRTSGNSPAAPTRSSNLFAHHRSPKLSSAATNHSAIEPPQQPGSKSLQEGIAVLPQRLDSYRDFRRDSSATTSGESQPQRPLQHHHASNHYPSIYGRLMASAAHRFSSVSSSSSSKFTPFTSSSANHEALSAQARHPNREKTSNSRHDIGSQPQPPHQQPPHQQQRHPRSRLLSNPESPSAYMLDRGQSLITTFQSKRGKTETLATDSNNVLQYPPPMAPITMMMRK